MPGASSTAASAGWTHWAQTHGRDRQKRLDEPLRRNGKAAAIISAASEDYA